MVGHGWPGLVRDSAYELHGGPGILHTFWSVFGFKRLESRESWSVSTRTVYGAISQGNGRHRMVQGAFFGSHSRRDGLLGKDGWRCQSRFRRIPVEPRHDPVWMGRRWKKTLF